MRITHLTQPDGRPSSFIVDRAGRLAPETGVLSPAPSHVLQLLHLCLDIPINFKGLTIALNANAEIHLCRVAEKMMSQLNTCDAAMSAAQAFQLSGQYPGTA